MFLQSRRLPRTWRLRLLQMETYTPPGRQHVLLTMKRARRRGLAARGLARGSLALASPLRWCCATRFSGGERSCKAAAYAPLTVQGWCHSKFGYGWNG
ncbi:hypothetical protein M758_UG006100 [Ceratodon purpureus]|nr:hypothetical protein M758_UG006100 [Ceratodon purpureus]